MVRRKSFHEIDSCFADKLAHDPLCFGSLLQFYDGLCSWEEDSSTPVLHIGWVKPIVKSFAAFEFSVRSKLDITILEEEEAGARPGGAACHRLPGASSGQDGRVKVTLFSSKIGDLKPLLQCEKLNSSALHLHLTAQSQTEVKKSRCSFEAEISSSGSSRVKRQRRE